MRIQFTQNILLGFLITTLALTSCVGAKNNDDQMLSLLALLILDNQSRGSFQMVSGSSISSMQSGLQTTSSALSATTLDKVNLAGRKIADYGDGTADGYTDKFLTPDMVHLGLVRIVAWKTPSNGGVAYGAETIDNADMVIYESQFSPCTIGAELFPNFPDPAGSVDLSNNLIVSSIFHNTCADFPDSSYDRIGLHLGSINYHFNAQQIKNQALFSFALRFPVRIIGSQYQTGHTMNAQVFPYNYELGRVLHAPLGAIEACTKQVKSRDPDTRTPELDELNISSCVASHANYWQHYIDKRTGYFSHASVAGESNILKYDLPLSDTTETDRFVKIFRVDSAKLVGKYKLDFKVDPTNVFTWDSNSTAIMFEPTVWPLYDASLFINGNGNNSAPLWFLDDSCVPLASPCYPTNTPPAPTNAEAPIPASGKDIKVHLPVIDLEIVPE